MNIPTELLLKKIRDNEAYVVSEKEDVAAGASHTLHLRNPGDSGAYLWLFGVNFTSKGEYTYTVYEEFSSITDGTSVDIQNSNLDDVLESECPFVAFHDSTFTPANGNYVGGVVGAGGGGGTSTGGEGEVPPTRVEPGREIVLEQTNDGNEAKEMTILCFFTE